MRIVSLIPSATEIVYLLGLGKNLVGRSHDSDYPKDVLQKTIVSDTIIDTNLPSREIDKKVRESAHSGRSLFHFDQEKIKKLKPDIILTQELCPVCAPEFNQVEKASRILNTDTKLISLEPHFLADVFQNILTIGKYTSQLSRAKRVVKQLQKRVKKTKGAVQKLTLPTVLVIEWLDPLMNAGHWVPELVEIAGGKSLLAKKGEKSKRITWREILKTNPDILIIAPCGLNIKRTKKEINLLTSKKGWSSLKAVETRRVYLIDGDAYLTRSGPRLVDATEILAKIIHTEIFGKPKAVEAEKW